MDNIVFNCAASTNSFYHHTIDHVIDHVRDDFTEEGYDEDMLRQLKMLWINKIESHHRDRHQEVSPSSNQEKELSENVPDKNKAEIDENTMIALKCLPANITSKVVQSNIAKDVLSPKSNVVEKKITPQKSEKSQNDSDDDDSDDSLEDDEESDNVEETKEEIRSEESLNSDDDYTDEEQNDDPFYTENLILCQYSFVGHTRNRWRFNFSDGVVCLNGEEFVFSSARGDAEW